MCSCRLVQVDNDGLINLLQEPDWSTVEPNAKNAESPRGTTQHVHTQHNIFTVFSNRFSCHIRPYMCTHSPCCRCPRLVEPKGIPCDLHCVCHHPGAGDHGSYWWVCFYKAPRKEQKEILLATNCYSCFQSFTSDLILGSYTYNIYIMQCNYKINFNAKHSYHCCIVFLVEIIMNTLINNVLRYTLTSWVYQKLI